MAYLEYPKHVYKGTPVLGVSLVVKNAAEEAAAVADGYAPLPAAKPDTPAFLKSLPSHLEYPKLVYRGEESVVVKSAEEEAARAAEGYLAVGAVAPDSKPVSPLADLSAKDAVAKVAELEDVAVLQAAVESEERATVVKAVQKRLADLAPKA